MPSPVELRPLRIGELIDRAARFWRANVWSLFQLYLGIHLATFAAAKLFGLAMSRWFPLFRGGSAMQRAVETDPDVLWTQLPALALAVAAFGLAVFTLDWLAMVCATRFAVDRMLGGRTTIRDALGHLRRRIGRALGTAALTLVYLAITSAFSMIPGAALTALALYAADTWRPGTVIAVALSGTLLAMAGLLIAVLWYTLRFVVTAQVVAMEEVGAFAALRRSARLLSGRVGPAFTDRVKIRAAILIALVALILLAVSMLSDLPQLVVMALYGAFADPAQAQQIPSALLVPAQLFQVFTQAVFAPLYVAFGAFLYVDLRARKEGLDLEVRLGALERGSGE